MRIGVPKERAEGERRVALVPEVVSKLTGKGLEVVIEAGAGDGAMLRDAAYEEAGATVSTDAKNVWSADVVLKVQSPDDAELAQLGAGSLLIGFLAPLTQPARIQAIAKAGVTSMAVEAIPRISRAQSMDALSSQSNVAGYRAALIGAQELGRFFPMLMTAAGTVKPAKVLVLGAGVAGLQAIATARRLGAVVTAYDVRPAVAEQIESLGATFLELDLAADGEGEGGYAKALDEEAQARQRELLADAIEGMDVVISTALVPGKPAPLLITADAVKRMTAGSVIVDLAGEAGGNCELSEYGETVVKEDVTIVAPSNLPSTMPEHASQLYARNLNSLLDLIITDGELKLDFDDEIVAGATVTRDGEIVHEGAKAAAAAVAS